MGTGIAIDQTGIRILDAARLSNGDVRIERAGYFPFKQPYEDWQSGFVKYQKDYTLPSGSAYIGVSGKHLSLRHVTLPARNEQELQKLVSKEVQQFAGSHQEKSLTHAFQRVPIPHSETNEVGILLGILRTEWIIQASELLKHHDLQIDACIPDAISIFETYRCCSDSSRSSGDVIMLGWLGYNSIDVCLVRNEQLIAARNTRGGISTILDASSASASNTELYQRLVGQGGRTDTGVENPESLVKSGVSRLSLRLSTAYDYFSDQFPDLPDQPDRLLICGPAARIKALPDKLSTAFGQSIDVLNPAEQVDHSNLPDHKKSAFREIGPEWATTLGLALAQDQGRQDLLLFKTPAAKDKETWWQVDLPAMVGFSFLFLCFLIYGIQSYRNNQELNSTRQNLQQELTSLRQRETTFNQKVQKSRSLHEQVTRISKIREQGLVVLEAFRQLPAVQPDQATMSSMKLLENRTVQVDGFVPGHVPNSLNVISRYKKNIEETTRFSVERKPREKDDGGHKQFRFLLSLTTSNASAKTR